MKIILLMILSLFLIACSPKTNTSNSSEPSESIVEKINISVPEQNINNLQFLNTKIMENETEVYINGHIKNNGETSTYIHVIALNIFDKEGQSLTVSFIPIENNIEVNESYEFNMPIINFHEFISDINQVSSFNFQVFNEEEYEAMMIGI